MVAAKKKAPPKAKPAPKPKRLTPAERMAETRDGVLKTLRLIGEGNTLSEACKKTKVPRPTVYHWMNQDAELQAEYRRQRELFAEVMVERLSDVAKTEPDVQRARLLCDNIKWTACKTLPRLYGDKVQVDATHTVKDATDEQLNKRLGALFAKAGLAFPDTPGAPAGP